MRRGCGAVSRDLPQLLKALGRDRLRERVPFTEEMDVVHRVVWQNGVPREHRGEIISRWLQKHQPCLFGRAAARDDRIHYCLVLEGEIDEKPESVQATVLHELSEWLKRSRRPSLNGPRPAHGFLLCVLGERVSNAPPDDHLKAFAEAVRSFLPLSRVAPRIDQFPLFLERPTDGRLFKFGVNLDYFGAQGDGRWWADHRFPGGIAFTLNSVGHQVVYNQWYGQRMSFDAQVALDRARETIRQSRGHPASGKNTAFDERLTPGELSYLAMYDTDENVREAFFRPPDVTERVPYSHKMGLAYLVDGADPDHVRLAAGEESSEEEFQAVLLKCREGRRGRPLETQAATAAPMTRGAISEVVARGLEVTRDWQISEEDLRRFYAE